MTNVKFYWIYILEVLNGKLYTGYSSNLLRRYREHLKGTAGSKFTRAFKVKKLRQCWRVYENLATVMKLEYLVKKQSRDKKLALIKIPRDLKGLAERSMQTDLRIYTFKPARIIKAAAAAKNSRRRVKPAALLADLQERDY